MNKKRTISQRFLNLCLTLAVMLFSAQVYADADADLQQAQLEIKKGNLSKANYYFFKNRYGKAKI